MRMTLALMAAIALSAATAVAAPAGRAVPDYGAFAPTPGAGERPQPARDYKVVFEVTQGAADPAKVSPGLDRVARFVNILAAGGVPAAHRHIVAVIDGPATEAVATDAAYGARHPGLTNPNARLIAELKAAGVDMRVCGQALAGHKLAAADVVLGVEIDVAALMTLTHKQLDGYALVES